MILVDVNLLLYAANPRCAEHGPAKVWWEARLSGREPVGLCWHTLASFVRISTHPKIFRQPLTREQAVEFVNDWLALPMVRIVEPAPQHWQTFRRLLLAAKPDPDLVTDAYLAALAMDRDCELNSTDEDFKHFPGLRWRNPIAPTPTPSS